MLSVVHGQCASTIIYMKVVNVLSYQLQMLCNVYCCHGSKLQSSRSPLDSIGPAKTTTFDVPDRTAPTTQNIK